MAPKARKPKAIRRRAARSYTQKAIRRANRKRKASGFEKQIHAVLKEEGIPFVREKAIGMCHADIFIEPKHLIELNGCYWHGHKCQGTLTKSQKTALGKDARRYYFFEKLGFKLTVIWECDFEKDPDSVRAKLRALYEKGKSEVV